MPNMTGRQGHRTMEMNGGSSAPYLACTPLRSLVCTLFNKAGSRRAFRLPRGGIISIVRWNLRPVIFGVENPLVFTMRLVCALLIFVSTLHCKFAACPKKAALHAGGFVIFFICSEVPSRPKLLGGSFSTHSWSFFAFS